MGMWSKWGWSRAPRGVQVYALLACAVFWYNNVHIPSAPTTRARFGGASVFLTSQANVVLMVYAALLVLHSVFWPHSVRCRALLAHLQRPLFCVGSFVGIAYYALLHNHPELAQLGTPEHDPWFWAHMHALHIAPLLFMVLDLLMNRQKPHALAADLVILYAYSALYLMWSSFCATYDGFPYPFQRSFSAFDHALFAIAANVSIGLLCLSARAVSFWMLREDRKSYEAQSDAPRARKYAVHKRASSWNELQSIAESIASQLGVCHKRASSSTGAIYLR
ncbi:hypothetical protein FVE85_4154 [Porphyridium purpureum]|uniref:FAR-17a/AIG1-like protein n=1 Tax=Porphyridium purpureum TaxID=35688 RepID=A0A5J4YS07_PORPP|nr:hypothetical protein FVE85_4154 [Porphyridium purpureum]|eukprot:POR3714..scf229_5